MADSEQRQAPTADDPAAYCAEQVRRFDNDRYLCTLFAPAAARAHLFALYAFNYEIARVREVARDPIVGQIRLQWWREAIVRAAEGAPRQHPVALALAATLRDCSLDPARFERLLTARELDLDDAPPADLAALETYAEGSSATLVELTLAVLGAGDAAAMTAGRHVGIAWALVGLLRAVPFHARQRRVYLPGEMIARAGIDAEQLFNGRPGDGLASAAREVAARAETHLAAARALARDVPGAALPALLPARLAALYLRRMASCGWRLFDPRLARPLPLRAWHLAWAAWSGRY
ncbi:MAG: squalene/phytoene synthase family protein [Proteobacteria bacterium]|nr:squalene/phytoene synthase family protein [Pseudomonadota bacterium]